MVTNLFFVFLLGCCVQFSVNTEVDNPTTRLLSRKKRYVAFPEGSSFSIAGCIAIGLIGQPAPASFPGTFTFGLNWAIAYELPNVTETAAYYHQKKYKINKHAHQRRSRRDLYERLESILDKRLNDWQSIFSMGYTGRQCILKALCETTQRIVPHSSSMVEEIFRTLFTMPITRMISSEPLEHTIYASAHRLGTLLENCDTMFNCPISLVDWAKGYYNAPPPTTDTQINPWALFSSTFR